MRSADPGPAPSPARPPAAASTAAAAPAAAAPAAFDPAAVDPAACDPAACDAAASDPAARIVPGLLCQHRAGGLYRVEARVTIEADGRPGVVYRSLADPAAPPWLRPLASFVETVIGDDGTPRLRFEPIERPDDAALRAACAAAGLPADVVEATLARYAEPQRHYHAAWHVHEAFARAGAAAAPLSRAQAAALLFHDAVYVAGADPGTNERLSALLLRQALAGRDRWPADEIDAACTMVTDTADHRPTVAGSSAVIALDLAPLGDDAVRFDAATELVRLEYRHLFDDGPDARVAFLRRRVRVLRPLLESTRALDAPPGWHERFASNVARLERRVPAA